MFKKYLQKNKDFLTLFKGSKNNKKGFTILFAVLVSVLVLAVGSSIVALSFKQIILSGSARESQFAFYASNSGYECALYWDFNGYDDGGTTELVFATSSESVLTDNEGDIECLGYDVLFEDGIAPDQSTSNSATSTFWIYFDGDEESQCAQVTLGKSYDSDADVIRTEINSYGYNTCDTDNPRRIERGLKVNY
jgi:hypothetical protein